MSNENPGNQWATGSTPDATPAQPVTRPEFAPWQTSQGNPGNSTWPQPGFQHSHPGTQAQTAQASPEMHTPTTRKAKRGSRLAGVIAVALLAGGLGGAGGAAATAALFNEGASSSQSVGESGQSNGTSTTVVQGDPTNPDWSAVAKSASDAVVAIQVAGQDGSGSQGSGVVIDNKGHIVTNNHVVASSSGSNIAVLLGNTSYEARIVGTDPSTDLAVIKLVDPPEKLTVMKFGDNNALTVGDPVMAIGNPLGLSDTVTTGIVSALNRPVTTRAVTNENVASRSDSLVVTAAIQTNAAINPGNSGGALVNTSGELVGITTSIATIPSSSSSSSSSGNIGIGFAIGADQVRYIADQLIEDGTAEHPQIGVSADDVTGAGQLGAKLKTVTPGSPAEKAGLQVGDLVTAVDGKDVTSVEQLVAVVRSGQVGKEMKLTVVRNGSEESVTVTPAAATQ